jgi:hypothetical protein
MDIKIKDCGKYVDGAIVSTAQSVPCQGTLRHVIDLHAQAPYLFLLPFIPVKRGPTALLNHTISHYPARTSQRKGRQMCIHRAAMRRAYQFGFWFNQGMTCVDQCGEDRRHRLFRSSLLFVLIRRLHLATD